MRALFASALSQLVSFTRTLMLWSIHHMMLTHFWRLMFMERVVPCERCSVDKCMWQDIGKQTTSDTKTFQIRTQKVVQVNFCIFLFFFHNKYVSIDLASCLYKVHVCTYSVFLLTDFFITKQLPRRMMKMYAIWPLSFRIPS